MVRKDKPNPDGELINQDEDVKKNNAAEKGGKEMKTTAKLEDKVKHEAGVEDVAEQSNEEEMEDETNMCTERKEIKTEDSEEVILKSEDEFEGTDVNPKAPPKEKKKRKTGVIYISRIPPGMCEGALRTRLSKMGKLGRVWLREEDAERRKERRKLGGSRRRIPSYRDGWAEFMKRGQAKKAVELLNSRPMAAPKGPGRWGNDLWCLKYLKGYSWEDLVEETCGTKRERVQRIKAEVARARREKAFVEGRAALAEKLGIEDGGRKAVRRFRQKRVIGQSGFDDDVDERRAREAQERVDEEIESGRGGGQVDAELVNMLFKKRRTN